jgi:hypothetical protein
MLARNSNNDRELTRYFTLGGDGGKSFLTECMYISQLAANLESFRWVWWRWYL